LVQEEIMRKLRRWGLAAALVAGLAAGRALAADDDAADSSTSDAPPSLPKQSSFRWSPAFAHMMQLNQPKPAPRKPDPPKNDAAKKPASPKPAAPAVDPAVAERSKAETALMRRLEVCDKLKEIALRSNDTMLFHHAEVLDERARTVYAQQTGSLAGALDASVSDSKPLKLQASAAGKPSDRRTADVTATAALGNTPNGPAPGKEVSR
jgi:hypothetical protein